MNSTIARLNVQSIVGFVKKKEKKIEKKSKKWKAMNKGYTLDWGYASAIINLFLRDRMTFENGPSESPFLPPLTIYVELFLEPHWKVKRERLRSKIWTERQSMSENERHYSGRFNSVGATRYIFN